MTSFVAEWALRSSVLIAAGTLLLWILRVKSASIRLAVWIAILCGSLLLPLLGAALPGLPVVTGRRTVAIEAAPVAIDSAPATAVAADPQPVAAEPRFDWLRFAAAIYAVGAGALLLRLCVGVVLGSRLLRASRATGRIADSVEVRESERVAVPVTLGTLRPAIVLPMEWHAWDETKLEAVLAHERSHVRRRDPIVQIVSRLHRALLWLTPLSWYLHRRIVRAAEEASDDAALAAVHDRASYAAILLDFMRGGAPRVEWQGVSMARYGSPEQRIRRILDGSARSRTITVGSVAIIVALLAPLAYVAAAVRPQSALETRTIAPITASAVAPQADAATRPAPAAAPAVVQAPQPSRASETTSATKATAATQVPATTQNSGTIHRYVYFHGESMSGSWDSEDPVRPADLRERFGDYFAWFRLNGRQYLVTDSGVLADLDKAMEPQKNVNRMQGGVNAEQSRVNGLQSKVNQHQNGVNALQNEVNRRQDLANQVQNAVNRGDNAALIDKVEAELRELRAGKPDINQESVNRRQAVVNHEQSGVNAEQNKVNALQHQVNDEQYRVSEEFNRQIQQILGTAVRQGTAKELQ